MMLIEPATYWETAEHIPNIPFIPSRVQGYELLK